MKYIDLHADTILPILQQGEDASLYENSNTHIDIKRLQKGQALAQCFAVWLPDGDFDLIDVDSRFNPSNPEEDLEYIDLAVNRLNQEIKQHSEDIAWAKNSTDIRQNDKDGKISAILTLEDARAINHSLENIERFYKQGFKIIGLLWNQENCLGFPNNTDPKINQKGLKPFGIEAIQYMEELGMLVDVSHLNDGGIADVLTYAKKPVLATHSNARSIANHPRNLIDEHIKGIAESGGLIGLCISPRFLRGSGNESTIEDMIRHLDYILDVGGEDVLAIGTDFDGTSGNFEIGSPKEMPKLFEHLEQHHWPLERIEKLAHKNALRVFKEF
ncbi:MAG TPA: dipeptidase [Candidatus Atopostipes pullistercoris]|uniref:Dipeptidase n=1 Tax=Candidatus Atopostipes pullistercoris TaxID=2838467 RepID=A0A9D2G0Y7_9LACT|nr:dipeptidase [Candidatus Atopostipes pullistercoris]